ncbi:MAG: transketolase [Lawsonibacter sp.]|jgi:transketolase
MQDMVVDLKRKSNEIRQLTLECIHSIGVGHVGGCLSIAEVLSCLYFGGLMHIDPQNPKMEGRDRLVVSKGHAGPAVYAALCSKGYFPKEQLLTLNQFGTNLPSHCDMNRTPGIDMTTGSLGQGFSCAVGIALGSKIKGDGATIYSIIGDGESQEGQIWEAAMFASQKKLTNLIAFTDYNKLQIDGTVDAINSLEDIQARWTAFGFQTYRIDGHDCEAILHTVKQAKQLALRPTMIILDTIKGKGVTFAENAGVGNHNMPLPDDVFQQAMAELRQEV